MQLIYTQVTTKHSIRLMKIYGLYVFMKDHDLFIPNLLITIIITTFIILLLLHLQSTIFLILFNHLLNAKLSSGKPIMSLSLLHLYANSKA